MQGEVRHYPHIDCLSVLHERQKRILGADQYASPGEVFVRFGFNLEYQTMSEYILLYSNLIFVDKSWQDFKRFLDKYKLRFKEKQLASETEKHFRCYFKCYLRESDPNVQTLLDLFDEAQDEWQRIMQTMSNAMFNVCAKYIKDNDHCHKFSELLVAYAWLNFGGDVIQKLCIRNDQESHYAQLSFCRLLNFYMDGETNQQLFVELRRTISTASCLVFTHLFDIIDKHKS